MNEYFGFGPKIWEEVAGIFPRYLHWLPKHCLSISSRRSLEICRLVIDNLTINDLSSFFFLIFKSLAFSYALVLSLFEFLFVIFQMNFNPWAGCEGYAKCEQALELNGRQVLFECGHGKYQYLGDRVLPQVKHLYPPATIPTPPCRIVWLADFLADEEIARAHDGYFVAEQKEIILTLSGIICKVTWLAERYFSSFLRSNFCSTNSFSIFLLGNNIFMLDFQPPASEGEEEGKEKEEIRSPHYARSSSSSFTETYPRFQA